jgi:hypothetical protein
VARERGGTGLVAGEGREYAFCSFARAAVGGGEEVQGVVCAQEGA